ncbi:hypothetical protein [Pseudomonas sp.]|uniref:hypothetical protein n=1 Tax=Pseudomonas sp. TaxID=306 RepID=UPI003D0E18AE
MAEKLRPGDEVKVAGQYIVVDENGARVPETPQYTLSAGDVAPPTPGKGMAFVLVDRSERASDAPTAGKGFGGRSHAISSVQPPKRGFVPGSEAGEQK